MIWLVPILLIVLAASLWPKHDLSSAYEKRIEANRRDNVVPFVRKKRRAY